MFERPFLYLIRIYNLFKFSNLSNISKLELNVLIHTERPHDNLIAITSAQKKLILLFLLPHDYRNLRYTCLCVAHQQANIDEEAVPTTATRTRSWRFYHAPPLVYEYQRVRKLHRIHTACVYATKLVITLRKYLGQSPLRRRV